MATSVQYMMVDILRAREKRRKEACTQDTISNEFSDDAHGDDTDAGALKRKRGRSAPGAAE